MDILSKFFKACFNFYSDQIDTVFVPLDFMIVQALKLTHEKVKKLVCKLISLLKSVIYEVSMQQATHMAAYSVAANKSYSTIENRSESHESAAASKSDPDDKNLQDSQSTNAKQKTKIKKIVFTLSSKWTLEKDLEIKDLIVNTLNRAVSETFF